MYKKIYYHLFSWDSECLDEYFEGRGAYQQAFKSFKKWVKLEPYLSWRLYRKEDDSEREDCVEAYNGIKDKNKYK